MAGKDLEEMLKISTSVGSDARLVQGGGGNTSVKRDDGLMYVKASGTSLGDMREGGGYRLVNTEQCAAIAEDDSLEDMDAHVREARVLKRLVESCADDLPGRPSVETSLHAMLGRCVVHTHPSIVNGLLCAEDGRAALAELFGDLDPPYLVIEYAGAGYTLARRMRQALLAYEEEHDCRPEVVFLENHGLFVTTEEADRALQLTRHVFEAIQTRAEQAVEAAGLPPFSPLPAGETEEAVQDVTAAMRSFYSDVLGRPALVRFDCEGPVQAFLRLPGAKELSQVSALMPDQVVYCRDHAVWVDLPPQLDGLHAAVTGALRHAEAGIDTPLCVLIPRLGLFSAAATPKLLDAVSTTMKAILETLSVAAHFGGPRGLDGPALEFLHGWEVERFRRTLVAGEGRQEDLAGKVALVSGAGSGLGRGISLCLARKGVHVVLADVELTGARETAERVQAQDGDGWGFPVQADVTSEAGVGELFRHVVRELGGLDLLVNCAGIAPANPLADFPLSAWQKTLDLNLTGYFLMAREAARRMVRQGTGGSIIVISSKTGLEASKHNSAYNATKAGEIHLARGWALDLAEHGIRVNTVCPGNVFTESRIWNEDYVAAIAEKRGIAPEDVIPHYVGLSALKQEITWDDVGEAVAFLASSRAAKITGQTLVVDGGQVFVR
jgi:NAD(P)-dependent dehydrogenase (short-subunit alcohol dehydrogenase family)/rhamnose utilization protein RhaD (predicted bifunctional aldolase and dehydrogenase)